MKTFDTASLQKATILGGLLSLVATVGVSVLLGSHVGAATQTSAPTPAFTATKTVTRAHAVAGTDVAVDSRTVTLNVSQTDELRDQQNITVTWKGAHPTGNVYIDPNADDSVLQEYPMVLLQCRGVDSSSVPVSSQVTPTTCWTPYAGSRLQTNGGAGGSAFVGNFPAWRLDRYADLADRSRYSDLPQPATTTCPAVTLSAERGVPFIAANGTAYYGAGLNTSCGNSPPEARTGTDGSSVAALPDNATFASTALDGTGSVKFNVRDAQTNASLGCSDSVPCSLVAVPIMGISCDGGAGLSTADAATVPPNAETVCERTGQYPAGSPQPLISTPDYSVDGALWWSASNWRNRISVPLTFAPPDNVCDLISAAQPSNIYGSELLTQATTQWSASLCTGANPTPLKHIQGAEPAARTLLSVGNIEAVFGSQPANETVPTVQAPVAVSGFAISYTIDDASGKPIENLRLTPRLLAKLMTESYPAENPISTGYQYIPAGGTAAQATNPLAHNPKDITYDPEFISLNPGIGHINNADGGRDALLSLSSSSDINTALTSYINADPEARAWLDGTPDPWGMQVNPNYKGISLPVSRWPLLDTYIVPTDPATDTGCDAITPQTPFLPRVGAPLSHLFDIAQGVQYAIPGALTACSIVTDASNVITSARFVRAGKQQPGRRFVIGLTSLGDARRYGLDTAALQTHVTSGAGTAFTDGSGRTFIAPTDDAVRQAAAALTYDPTSQTWPIPYDALRTTPADQAAYPGTMIVYADIPTTGLPPADATSYSQILKFIVGPGQVSGVTAGTLAPGFVSMDTANGLAVFADYSLRAAAAVAAQSGEVPPLVPAAATAATASANSAPEVSAPTQQGTSTPSPAAGTSGRSASRPATTTSRVVTGSSSSRPEYYGTDSVPASGGAPGQQLTGGAAPQSTKTQSSATKSAQASGSPTATVAPLRSLGNTVGQKTSETQLILYLIMLLLVAGPIGSPAILLLRRRRSRS